MNQIIRKTKLLSKQAFNSNKIFSRTRHCISNSLTNLYKSVSFPISISPENRIRKKQFKDEDLENRRTKRINKTLFFLKEIDHIEHILPPLASQMEHEKVFSKLQQLLPQELLVKKKENLVKYSLGSKAIPEELLKKQETFTIEKFEKYKAEIVKRFPELEEYDLEKRLAKMTFDERVKYFVDMICLESDGSDTKDELRHMIDLIKENRKKSLQQDEALKNTSSELSDALEDYLMEDPESESVFDPDRVLKLLEENTPVEELTIEDARIIMEKLNEEVNYLDAYYKNKIYMDEMRLISLQHLTWEMREEKEETYQITDNNEHLVRRHFDKIDKYYDYSRSEHIARKVHSYATTLDNHRVDVGLIFNRPPIFIHVPEKEIEFMKYRRNTMNKYYLDMTKYIQEFEVFDDVKRDISTQSYGGKEINLPNMRALKTNDNKRGMKNISEFNNNDYDFYSSHSKFYKIVDPDILDSKSIQTESCYDVYLVCKNKFTGRWEFPTMPLRNGDSFKDAKRRFLFNLVKNEFKYHLPPNFKPIMQLSREFFEFEREDIKNKGLAGSRSYYFISYHLEGRPFIFPNELHPYVDFAWASKGRLKEFMTKEYYESVVDCLR